MSLDRKAEGDESARAQEPTAERENPYVAPRTSARQSKFTPHVPVRTRMLAVIVPVAACSTLGFLGGIFFPPPWPFGPLACTGIGGILGLSFGVGLRSGILRLAAKDAAESQRD